MKQTEFELECKKIKLQYALNSIKVVVTFYCIFFIFIFVFSYFEKGSIENFWLGLLLYLPPSMIHIIIYYNEYIAVKNKCSSKYAVVWFNNKFAFDKKYLYKK